uniref:Sialidase-1 n=1 Tax=Tetraodon nigroviridis TaxID=99883 RepID=H3CET0_TETNG
MGTGMQQLSVALWLFLSAVTPLCVKHISPEKIDPLVYEEQQLWVSGVKGKENTYRIPLPYTPKGRLQAFAEARKASSRDAGQKFIAMRRSTGPSTSVPAGATWSPTRFIVDDGQDPDGLNLGSLVVDEEKGLIILVYSLHFHTTKAAGTMMVVSDTDGLSWSRPRNISGQIGVQPFSPGPGFGIQKKNSPKKFVNVLHSNGTWPLTIYRSKPKGFESKQRTLLSHIPTCIMNRMQIFNPSPNQPVEMTDGSIIVNVRNQNYYHCRCRIVVRSLDGGLTLPIDQLYFDYTLVDPAVAAGALQKDGVLYFTNPAHEYYRINLTLRWSTTHGQVWENKTVRIWGGPSGYSSMTSLNSCSVEDSKFIYVIYEKGLKNYYETISFVKIHLFGGKDGM